MFRNHFKFIAILILLLTWSSLTLQEEIKKQEPGSDNEGNAQPTVKDGSDKNGGEETKDFFEEYKNVKCINECMEKQSEQKAIHPPKTQREWDQQIQPYLDCFDENCPGIHKLFDNPHFTQDKYDGRKIQQCHTKCKSKLDSNYYRALEQCKYECFIDQSQTTSENISSILFVIMAVGIVGFLVYKRKTQ